MTWARRACAVAATALLAACGGGSDRVQVGPDYAEGLWAGATHSGGTLDGVVLETGEYWLVFGVNGVASNLIVGSGFMNGRIFGDDEGIDYAFRRPPPFASTLRAEVNPRIALSGSMWINDRLERFDLNYVRDYDFSPNPNELIGNWQGEATTLETVDAISFAIGADGRFTAALSGCEYAGSIWPRGNRSNVFHFDFVNHPACPYAFRATGVVISTAGRLVFTGTTPDRRDAFYAVVR